MRMGGNENIPHTFAKTVLVSKTDVKRSAEITLHDNVVVTELGVFAKKQILKRTQFGPIVAPTTTQPPDAAAARRFLLMVKLLLFSG